MGGEKSTGLDATSETIGSPPHRRGKGWNPCWRGLLNRITPAWAGKRRCTAACNGLCWDHPRMGGEKVQILLYEDIQKGSPPRGRGKVNKELKEYGLQRITPAWAGKRPEGSPLGKVKRDHPRVGGEKHLLRLLCQPLIGSPPRGRGKAFL